MQYSRIPIFWGKLSRLSGAGRWFRFAACSVRKCVYKPSHLHQDLSAGQHAVLVGERLAQLVEGGRALPEDKQV